MAIYGISETQAMDKLNRRDLMSAEKLLDKCRKLIDERDYLGAMDVCDEILKTALNSQSANGYKAWCLYLLDRYDEATEHGMVFLFEGDY